MTSPTPMAREDLLELAPLDALGMLDDYESALFTRSFHHAPAAVQDEIKELQAKVASNPVLLPKIEPPARLRERVLMRVDRAIEEGGAELRPLATIGRRRPLPARRPPIGTVAMAEIRGFFGAISTSATRAGSGLAWLASATRRGVIGLAGAARQRWRRQLSPVRARRSEARRWVDRFPFAAMCGVGLIAGAGLLLAERWQANLGVALAGPMALVVLYLMHTGRPILVSAARRSGADRALRISPDEETPQDERREPDEKPIGEP
ncbi:MAG: hypothetical protein GY725_24900 [bacterium]|nr:hypothetical protein [bacterium]